MPDQSSLPRTRAALFVSLALACWLIAPPAFGAVMEAPPCGQDTGITCPRRVHCPRLAYPVAARKAGIEGIVEVSFVVTAEGKVEDAVANSGPSALRESALEHVRQCTYEPGREKGVPRMVRSRIHMTYRLGSPYASRTPAGASNSTPVSPAVPPIAPSASAPRPAPGLASPVMGGVPLLTQGKAAADLGDHEGAAQAFATVAKDAGVPARARGEAWVRLGIERRQLADPRGSLEAFQRAMAVEDAEVRRLLTLAVDGVMPGAERWSRIWRQVVLNVTRDAAGVPRAEILWPGAQSQKWAGTPISFHAQDADLVEMLRALAGDFVYKRIDPAERLKMDAAELRRLREVRLDPQYVVPAELAAADYVMEQRVAGRVTVHVDGVPWDHVLDSIMQATGHEYRKEGKLLRFARAGELPPAAATARRYSGEPINMHFRDGVLDDILMLFAEISQGNVLAAPAVSGTVTVRLRDVPWDQALTLILETNGLVSRHEGRLIRVGGPGDFGPPRAYNGAVIDLAFDSTDDAGDLLAFFERAGGVSIGNRVEALGWIRERDRLANVSEVSAARLALKHSAGPGSTPERPRRPTQLKQLPWDQALDAYLWLHSLTFVREGQSLRVVRIGSRSSS